MLSATTLPLALLATLTTVTASSFNSPHHQNAVRRAPSHHWTRSNLPGRVNNSRPRLARRGSSDEPSTLSEGALTASEGCTKWYHVNAGDSCYSALSTVGGDVSLEAFYAMNPQVDGDCFNLWAGFDYCVARTTTSVSSSAATKPVVKAAVVKAASSPSPTTTSAAPSSSATDDEDEDCDAEDEEFASTSAAVKVADAAVQKPTPAPTSKDDSAAKAAASKASADAAWASSSKASADAAWASSSKAAADAAWASSSKAAADAAWASSSKATAAAAQTASAPETTKVADVSGGNAQSKLTAMGVKTFLGKQTGAIASWFRTNSAQDSTNGNSWCYRPYSDDLPLFAPSLKTMLASAGGDPIAAGKLFCGLEAIVSTDDGRSAKMFIGDAFDDRWVLTPTSIDVAYGAFHLLFGSTTDNKNDVAHVSWELTGDRRSDYVFNNGNPV